MKVLHVISGDLWAGAEVQVFTLLSALTLHPDVQVAAAVLNEGDLSHRLRERGISITLFPESELNGVQILLGLRGLMNTWRPDIVHTHRTKENVLGSIANALTHNVPSLRTSHGAPEHAPTGIRQFHKRCFQQLDRWCGRHLQQSIIAVSEELAQKLAGQYGATPIVVIENGVDVASVQAAVAPVEFRMRHPDAIHVGIVGRLVPVKRVDLFLETAELLVSQAPEITWRFHVFGDGPLRASLTERAAALNVSSLTTFHGHRSDSVACMAALDALVITSDHEGLPMTVLESVTVGTPVVAHATGGLINVLQTEPSARLVADHSAQGYAAAVRSLVAGGAIDRARGIDPRFSSSHNAAAVSKLYRALLAPARITNSQVRP